MHSYEERMKAVQLFIKYDLSVADTIRELGYPTRNTLIRWYNEYLEKGDLHEKFQKKPRFTQEEKRKAVDYYLEHGRCIRRTVRKLGYPSRTTLTQWIDELAPGERKIRITQGSMVKFSQEQKKEAVISLCTNEASAASLAEKRGIRRETLYKWKKQLLSEEGQITVEQLRQKPLPDDKDELEMELESLKRQVYRLQLELDILQKAAEVVKKDQGIDLRKMTNREKTIVIDALREKYPLNELLAVVAISKSSCDRNMVGDRVDMYLLFTNSHDGSSSIRVAVTPIRVVCQNTLTYGLKAARRTWSIRHTSGAKERLNQAVMALKMTYRFGDAMRIDAEKLVAKRVTLEEYLDRLIPLPRVDEKTTERMVANTKFVRDQLFDMAGLWDLAPFKDTAWGNLQTIANYVSHGDPVRRTANFAENRFEKLLDGHELLQRAHDLAHVI
jgi:transposase-like protein